MASFTLFTFGIYGSWFTINLRKYIIDNLRMGSVEFEYNGDGADYFVMNLKGYFLSIFTLGIYMFWWQKDIINYLINNISLHKDDKEIQLNSTLTGGGIFKLSITNALILFFTLGFGYAWVVVRSMKYLYSNIEFEGNINFDELVQTEENYKDATGDDVSDFLNMDFV